MSSVDDILATHSLCKLCWLFAVLSRRLVKMQLEILLDVILLRRDDGMKDVVRHRQAVH